MHQHDRWSPLLPADDEPSGRDYNVRGEVWRWQGDHGLHFVTLPEKDGSDIRKRFGRTVKGWGSIRVRICIGETEWATSLFPHKEANSYLFAIKAGVRKAEKIRSGDTITATVHIL